VSPQPLACGAPEQALQLLVALDVEQTASRAWEWVVVLPQLGAGQVPQCSRRGEEFAPFSHADPSVWVL
jgi:hypothetical protein